MQKEYSLATGIEHVIKEVEKDFPGVNISLDKELRLYHFYIPEIDEGIKNYTIRFKPGCVRLPAGIKNTWFLPCYATSPDDKDYLEDVGLLRITKVGIAIVKDFPAAWAKLDGFKTKKEMLARISEIYHYKLKPKDFLSIYKLDQLFRHRKD